MHTVHIIVTGYVQGVGFRNYVEITARTMGIKGEVWNGHDRAVHIVAQHADESVLKRFEEEMENGPGRVDEVRVSPAPDKDYRGFEVTASR